VWERRWFERPRCAFDAGVSVRACRNQMVPKGGRHATSDVSDPPLGKALLGRYLSPVERRRLPSPDTRFIHPCRRSAGAGAAMPLDYLP